MELFRIHICPLGDEQFDNFDVSSACRLMNRGSICDVVLCIHVCSFGNEEFHNFKVSHCCRQMKRKVVCIDICSFGNEEFCWFNVLNKPYHKPEWRSVMLSLCINICPCKNEVFEILEDSFFLPCPRTFFHDILPLIAFVPISVPSTRSDSR